MANVFEIAKSKLKGQEIDDIDITIGIEEIEQEVKNYCNVEIIPDSLAYTIANMAVDLILYQHLSVMNTNSEDADLGEVSSIKIGDTAINFSKGTSAVEAHKAKLGGIVFNYQEKLNRHRKMVW